ncbi:hypothetical protein EB093_06715 [bacterium]|nr:hypothetical protein [bacterium]
MFSRYSVHESMISIPATIWTHWTGVPAGLTYTHLCVNEKTLASQVRFWYVIFWQEDRPVGIAQFQLFRLDARSFVGAVRRSGVLPIIEAQVKELLHKGAGLSKIWVVLCGDLYATGPSFYWFENQVNREDQWEFVSTAVRRVVQWADERVSPELIVIKDFMPDELPGWDDYHSAGFHCIETDPNMILDLRDWRTFDDYLGEVKARYRHKIKAVMSACESVESHTIHPNEIDRYSQRMDHLHSAIFERAEVKYLKVPDGYFAQMSKFLPHHYTLRGYWLQGELIGFVSYHFDHSIMKCQYFGLDRQVRDTLPIYQYLLIDAIAAGLERTGIRTIEYGRTASEMKSAVGAEPHSLYALVKHRNPIKNQLVDVFVQLLHPVQFERRHVFKS